ncbi:DUF6470 family protein [Paenibacillus sp. Leaf72]|uniref:DUF6470 family protein n=1 Tax=Paenibacillus sp. Leaf72 TaxID=1736234 RepID=UPI0006F80A17|nr:DUF6470 family protein [Paenibacillus sp. Leaf72]KQO11006.1 hypothetical protein ASF12_11585 [Paenibacillus sp. Leaf72]
MKLPQLQIQSTSGKIGIQSGLGKYDIKQGHATMDISTVNTIIDVKSTQPVLIIDQSKMWDALTGGKPEAFWNRLYNQFGQFVIQGIEQTVQEYDRIGDILYNGDPVGDIAGESLSRQQPALQVYGPASVLNVRFDVVIEKPEINVTPGHVKVDVQTNKPQIEYRRGGVNIYMERYPSVQITPPQIDLTL